MTPKQQRFVEEYLIDLNATQAAIRAGYTEKTARQQGCRLLTNADIQNAIADANTRRMGETQYDSAYVMKEAGDQYEKLKGQGEDSTARGYLELLGKHINVGAFEDKMRVAGDITVTRKQYGRSAD